MHYLLSATISWSPLNHLTSPPSSSNSQTSVNVSFSTSCWDFSTFTNLYGYSVQRDEHVTFHFFKKWLQTAVFTSSIYKTLGDNIPTMVRTVSVLSVCLLILQMYSPLSSSVALFIVNRQTPLMSFDILYKSPS